MVSLKRAIPVALEFWEGLVTARCHDLTEFGTGADEFEALDDLRASIVDLYSVLKADQGNLGPLAQRQLDYLEDIIRER